MGIRFHGKLVEEEQVIIDITVHEKTLFIQ